MLSSTKEKYFPVSECVKKDAIYVAPGNRFTDNNYYQNDTLCEEWGVNRKIRSLSDIQLEDDIEKDTVQLIARDTVSNIIHETNLKTLDVYPEEFLQYFTQEKLKNTDIQYFNYNINNELDWIDELDIYLIDSISLSANAVPCTINDNVLTIYNQNKIQKASIIFLNPYKRSRFDLIRIFIHELRHLYDVYFTGKKYTRYLKVGDIELGNKLCNNIQYDLIYPTPHELRNRIKRWNEYMIKSYIGNFMYWLNKEESEAHLENIFNEMYQYFKSDDFKDYKLHCFEVSDIPDLNDIKNYLLRTSSQILRVYKTIRFILTEIAESKQNQTERFWKKYNTEIIDAYNLKFTDSAAFINFLMKRCDKVIKHGSKYFAKFWGAYMKDYI